MSSPPVWLASARFAPSTLAQGRHRIQLPRSPKTCLPSLYTTNEAVASQHFSHHKSFATTSTHHEHHFPHHTALSYAYPQPPQYQGLQLEIWNILTTYSTSNHHSSSRRYSIVSNQQPCLSSHPRNPKTNPEKRSSPPHAPQKPALITPVNPLTSSADQITAHRRTRPWQRTPTATTRPASCTATTKTQPSPPPENDLRMLRQQNAKLIKHWSRQRERSRRLESILRCWRQRQRLRPRRRRLRVSRLRVSGGGARVWVVTSTLD